MTHSGGKPHAVGDRGQRYEIRATGWPKEGKSVIGWWSKLDGADEMMASLLKAPSCTSVEIFDREKNEVAIVRFGGVLR